MKWLIFVLVALGLAGSATARPRLGVRVAVDVEARTATGRLAADIENPTSAPLDHLEFWRFPARLERRSGALDEHNFYWVYPNHFDAGTMAISNATAAGDPVEMRLADDLHAGPGTLVIIPLPTPLLPGTRISVELTFATRIPYRYGAFGCYRHGCTLAGGFYPMPVELGPAGYDRTAPPARADIDITVDSRAEAVLIDGAPARAAHVEDAAWAVVIAGAAFRESVVVHRGVRVVYRHHGGRPPGRLDGDRARLVLDDIREAIDMLHEIGIPPPAGVEIRLVDTPMRMELASAQAHAVLVSDQIYRILPLNRFRKFHSFQLVGAVFDSLFESRLAARERPADLAYSPNVASAWLVDLYTIRVYRKKEFARDILRWVSFIPAIDRILYAPQIPFATAYFNTLDDPDATRDDLHRFASDWPRGKLIHEKLRDLLGDAGMTEVMYALWDGAPLRQAAEATHGEPLDWFFTQWLGPYPDVDYRFEVLRREKTRSGYRYHFRIWKRGDHPPGEPVELLVTEWGGTRHTVRWDGRGRDNAFTVETHHLVRAVALDPRGRLTESVSAENDDHRLDDRTPGPVKFIYNNFGALFNFQTLQLDLSLDFSLQRIYDLKHSSRFVVYHSESTTIGGLIGYSYGFGRKVTPSRLTSALTTSVRVARLDPGFAASFSGVRQPGTRISVGAGIGYDDRFFIWEPWRYTSIGASITYALTVLDDGRTFQQITGAAGITRTFPITPGHGVALEAGLAATFGDLKLPSQALFAGGPGGALRGYAADELAGRSIANLRVEYRHVFVHDLDFNLLWLFYFRGIGGGLFAEAALVSPCDAHIGTVNDAAHGLSRNLFGDVGYSLRFLGDFFGVSQTVFNIDVSVPVFPPIHRDRPCFPSPNIPTAQPTNHFPLAFYIYFGPVW